MLRKNSAFHPTHREREIRPLPPDGALRYEDIKKSVSMLVIERSDMKHKQWDCTMGAAANFPLRSGV